jgi:hypothetical protein
MDMTFSTNFEKKAVCRVLVEKSPGKRSLGSPRRRWVDNIMLDLGELEWTVLIWLRMQTSEELL